MSLEVAIAENTKALNNLALLISELKAGRTVVVDTPAPKSSSKKSAPPADSVPAETVSAAPPSAEPKEQTTQAGAESGSEEVTPADLRKQFATLIPALVKAGKKVSAQEVLAKYGATQVPQIKDADLAKALADLQAL
jgi:hypothetical protein